MRDPAFWWREGSAAATLLTPASVLYGAIAAWRMARPGRPASVPVVCVGNFTLGFTDFYVPVAGIPMQVDRNYDSRNTAVGDFGAGWTLGLKNVRLEKNVVLGENWSQTSRGGFFPTYCVEPTVAPNVTLGTDENSVFSNGGTAIVIHAVAGGTGTGAPPRIACGVITKPE